MVTIEGDIGWLKPGMKIWHPNFTGPYAGELVEIKKIEKMPWECDGTKNYCFIEGDSCHRDVYKIVLTSGEELLTCNRTEFCWPPQSRI